MELDNDLITRFAKMTKFSNKKDSTTVRGKVKIVEDRTYIQLDGADETSMTPAETTVEVATDDRVIATMKDHSVIITGNKTNPSIGTVTAGKLSSSITQTADAIKLEVSNTEADLYSAITQTANAIKTEVSNTESELKSAITQTANEIKSEVANVKSGLSTTISQTESSIKSEVSSIDGRCNTMEQTLDGVTFTSIKGVNGATKTVIDGGSIKAETLQLTGAITWNDLDEDVQSDIIWACEDAADAVEVANDAAFLANKAITAAESMKLPEYIQESYIDEAEIRSPKIIGGEIYAVGSDPEKDSTFSAMTENGFFLYHNATKSDANGDIHPKISLTVGNSGSIFSNGGDKVSIIVGAGESDTSLYRHRLFIEKDPDGAYIRFYYKDGTWCGLSMWGDGKVTAHGKWDFSTADSVTGIDGSGSSGDPLDAWPVGSIMLKYNHASPASYLGGSWTRLSPYFLYAAGAGATIGDTGYVVTDVVGAQSVNTAQFIKVTAWRRTS